MTAKKTLLFMGESVTLSHTVRPFVLASGLIEDGFSVHLAAPDACRAHLSPWPEAMQFHNIHSLSSQEFLERLQAGRPIYDSDTIERQVREDLDLIEKLEPVAIISDMRLSLTISARVAGVPLLSIVNAYWQPKARVKTLVPDIPVTRWLGPTLAQPLFDLLQGRISAQYAQPFNLIAKRYGLAQVSNDVRTIYTDGDFVLYPDMAELVTVAELPRGHRFIGPVNWAPAVDAKLPAIDPSRPLVVVTLGSSGDIKAFARVIETLASLPVQVFAATSGRATLDNIPENTFVAPLLPLDALLPKAAMFICNGGSGSIYHALACGVPVIGLASNLDQFLAMASVEEKRLGKTFRARGFSRRQLRRTVESILNEGQFSHNTAEFKPLFWQYEPIQALRDVLSEELEITGGIANKSMRQGSR